MSKKEALLPFYSLKLEKVRSELNTDFSVGLGIEEVEKRLQEFGHNALPEVAKTPLWRKFLAQFEDFLIYILIAGLVFSFLAGEYIDGVAILEYIEAPSEPRIRSFCSRAERAVGS